MTSSGILVSSVADYCGNVVYFGLGTGVSRLLTGEGYVNRQYGMFGDWVYTYTLKDHLGSVRYEFDQSGTTRGYTHYYPFGAEYAESGTPSLKPERYTGQEFDGNFGLNTYDYIARGLDGILGRFNQPDPLAEKYYSWSPYVF